MNVLVTGANGFVGYELAGRLIREGHSVTGGVGPGRDISVLDCTVVDLDLTQPDPLGDLDLAAFDAVVHLAAMASSSDASRDPALAWIVNAVGTVRLLEAFGDLKKNGIADPTFLMVSTCDVYQPCESDALVHEDSPQGPVSAYAASKLAAEIAADEISLRTGLRVIVARPFPHTGAGQDARFVVPDFARKIRAAKLASAPAVRVGDLRIVRELLHVGDVVDAYVRLLHPGVAGEVYNIARGEGYSLTRVFDAVADAIGYRPVPETNDGLTDRGPVVYQVGDSTRLRAATGWEPTTGFDDIIREVAAASGSGE